MYDRLVFKGYSTHSLVAAAQRFKEQTKGEAKAFVRRESWAVHGPRELQEIVFNSRFASAFAISIPLYLDLEELKRLEAERNLRRVSRAQQIKPTPKDGKIYDTKRCQFCGRKYEITAFHIGPHCGREECKASYGEVLKQNAMLKRSYSTPKPNIDTTIQEQPAEESEQIDFSMDDPNVKTLDGWVYLIESCANGLHRIGRSNDVYTRFSCHVAENATDLLLIHTIRCSNYVNAERYLHDLFFNKRDHGEWFQLDTQDVGWLLSLKDGDLNSV